MLHRHVFWPISCVLLSLVILIAGCGGGGGGSAPTGQVQGYITTTGNLPALAMTERAAGTPVDGATISVQGTALSTTTREDGYFLLSGVPIGPQVLLVTKSGYDRLAVSVTVQANVTVTAGSATITPVTRKWTVLVFMNANNDLESYGIQDMNEMESVPTSDQVAVVVQMSRSPNYDTSNANWSGTRLYKVTHDDDLLTINSTVLEDRGDIDMGSTATLSEFITRGKALYPAEHYLLVLWDHGSGVLPLLADDAMVRGISYDYTHNSFISTKELPLALPTSPPLDIIASDACLMQMFEIAYQIRSSCNYLVGSEENVPGTGYAYQTWLGTLVANPAMAPRDLARTMAQQTLQYYGTSSNLTHSAIDMSQLENLATAISHLATALGTAEGPVSAPYLADARNAADTYANSMYKDLVDYAAQAKARVGPLGGVSAAADEVTAAVHNAVYAEYHGVNHANAHGVSILIPTPPVNWTRTAPDYLSLDSSLRTGWGTWLSNQLQ